jgi:hypothetical protein
MKLDRVLCRLCALFPETGLALDLRVWSLGCFATRYPALVCRGSKDPSRRRFLTFLDGNNVPHPMRSEIVIRTEAVVVRIHSIDAYVIQGHQAQTKGQSNGMGRAAIAYVVT